MQYTYLTGIMLTLSQMAMGQAVIKATSRQVDIIDGRHIKKASGLPSPTGSPTTITWSSRKSRTM